MSDIKSIKLNNISISESFAIHSTTNTFTAELALSSKLCKYTISADSINLLKYENSASHFINLNTAAQFIKNEQQPSQLESISEELKHLSEFQIY